jgi:hypothetical protein
MLVSCWILGAAAGLVSELAHYSQYKRQVSEDRCQKLDFHPFDFALDGLLFSELYAIQQFFE